MGTTITTTEHMSLQEFLALPEDGPYAEFVHGEFVEMVRPSFEHNELASELQTLIRRHCRARSLGRVSGDVLVILDQAEEVVYAPDIVFVAAENVQRIRDGRVWGAPDLVVEVLSQYGESRDRGAKMDDYAEAGVPWYWIIDLDAGLVEEYRLTPQGYVCKQATSAGSVFNPLLFPGLDIDLAWLLPRSNRS